MSDGQPDRTDFETKMLLVENAVGTSQQSGGQGLTRDQESKVLREQRIADAQRPTQLGKDPVVGVIEGPINDNKISRRNSLRPRSGNG